MDKKFENDLRLLEALIFASKGPISERKIIDRLPADADLSSLLSTLVEFYQDRGFNLKKIGNSWAFRTADNIGAQLRIEREVHRKLSRAAVETLAIVAYHQPITRSEMEEIRGVSLSKGTIDILFEAGWIGPKGRRRTPGRPVTWGTTEGFLDHFGLESIEDLPGLEDLKSAGLLDKRPAINVSNIKNRILESGEQNSSSEQIENEIEVIDPADLVRD